MLLAVPAIAAAVLPSRAACSATEAAPAASKTADTQAAGTQYSRHE